MATTDGRIDILAVDAGQIDKYLAGNLFTQSLQAFLGFNNLLTNWAPQDTSGHNILNGGTISVVNDITSPTGKALKTTSIGTGYDGWTKPATVAGLAGQDVHYGVYLKDNNPSGFLVITELDFYNSVGGYLGNAIGWWHAPSYTWVEVNAIAPAGTFSVEVRILHDHAAFDSWIYGERLWIPRTPLVSLPKKTLAGALSFSGAFVKRASKTFVGGLSFAGAQTRQRVRQLFSDLEFNDLLADFTPWSFTGWTNASVGTTTHQPSPQVLKWPYDAYIQHTQTVTSALDDPAKLVLSPKVNVNATEPVRVKADYKTSAASGQTFDLAVLIYDNSNVLLGWWFTSWGIVGVWEQAETVAPFVLAGQAKAAIGFRSNTSGETVLSSRLLIQNQMVVAVRSISFAGALSFSGSILRKAGKTLSGALSFSGVLIKQARHGLTAALSFSGSIIKQTRRSLSGVLSFIGAVTTTKVSLQALTGALSFSGNLLKRAGKDLTGGLSFVGAIIKRPGKALSGALSFAGNIVRQSSKALTGTLNLSSAFNTGKSLFFSAILTFSGAIAKRANKVLTGVLSFAGAISRSARKSLSGALSFVGSLSRIPGRIFTGILSFSGALGRRIPVKFTAGLSFTGAMVKRAGKALTGGLSFAGAVIRFPLKGFVATISPAGALVKNIVKDSVGSLSFSSIFDSHIIGKFIDVTVKGITNTLAVIVNSLKFIGILTKTYNILVKAYSDMAFKIGTVAIIEATFTDKDGNLFDPDTGTAKLSVKKPDGTYYSGFLASPNGAVMTKISTGLYQKTFQSAFGDPRGLWTFEVEGYSGPSRTVDDAKIQFRP